MLGTTTALVLEGVLGGLFRRPFSEIYGDWPGERNGVTFSLGGVPWGWLGLAGAAMCAVGVLGDLWESLLKRTAMVKVRAICVLVQCSLIDGCGCIKGVSGNTDACNTDLIPRLQKARRSMPHFRSYQLRTFAASTRSCAPVHDVPALNFSVSRVTAAIPAHLSRILGRYFPATGAAWIV